MGVGGPRLSGRQEEAGLGEQEMDHVSCPALAGFLPSGGKRCAQGRSPAASCRAWHRVLAETSGSNLGGTLESSRQFRIILMLAPHPQRLGFNVPGEAGVPRGLRPPS